MLTFRFESADGEMIIPELLTSGMVGKEVKLEFSGDWDGLAKTAVFTAGAVTRDVVDVTDTVVIPAEVLAVPLQRLSVGVYGVTADGRVTPTVRARGPMIEPGADPSGDPGTDPDLPVWAQQQLQIQALETREVDLSGYVMKTPEIVGTTVGEKAMAFSHLMHGTDKTESFIFFADPHFLNSINNEAQMRDYLDILKLYYDVTPASFVVDGGDWYGNSDTYESACFKLGYIGGWMRRLFGDQYYPAVGNHDTNQQGVDETGGTWTGILPKETVRNLWLREQDSTYHAFDGVNTRFYVLDTWKEGDDADHYAAQLTWLSEKLKADNPENAALILHMGYYPLSTGGYGVNTLAEDALTLCMAFNNGTPINLNSVAYDFTSCSGKVRFALCGHIHADYATIVNGIPLIATTHMRDGNTPTFDLCLADYAANTLTLVRVGTGENRTFTMAPDGAILDGSEEDTGGEDNGITLLLGMNLTGPNLYNNVTFRSVYVGAAQPDGISKAIPWSSASTGDYPYSKPYYPIEIPDGATRVVVTCPASVKWAVLTWTKDDWNALNGATVDSGWLSAGGGTYELPAESEVLIILFNDNNAADMSADTYDSSTFSLTFSSDDDTTEEDTTLPVTLAVADPVVFLNGCNHNGAGINYYDRPTRSLIVTTENTGVTYSVGTGTTDTTHYALVIPDGATTVTVNCGDGLQWSIDTINADGGQRATNGAWLENGANTAIPENHIGYYLIKLCNADGSAFAADFDYSGISWTFA